MSDLDTAEVTAKVIASARVHLDRYEKKHGPVTPLAPGATVPERTTRLIGMRFLKREILAYEQAKTQDR